MQDVIEQFTAESDNGNRYIIVFLQNYKEHRNLKDGKVRFLPSTKEYKTDTGLNVDMIDAKTFQIVETEEIVRKL